MGREIRRVPEGWKHPRKRQQSMRGDWKEDYTPVLDKSFEPAARQWIDDLELWLKSEHETQKGMTVEEIARLNKKYPDNKGLTLDMYEPTILAYIEYVGDFPDRDFYRPDWTDEERTHFQMYETVSEGTPVSPVFASKEDLADWLVKSEGYSRETADKFMETEWAPTFMIVPQKDGSSVLLKNLEGLNA